MVSIAQWVPLDKNGVCDLSWFDRIRRSPLFHLKSREKSMSELTADWKFRNVREIHHPYIKRTRLTNSRALSADAGLAGSRAPSGR